MATALKSTKFVKAITKPLKKFTKNSNSKMAKIKKNIFIISIIANIAKAIEKIKVKKNILYIIIKSIYYFI